MIRSLYFLILTVYLSSLDQVLLAITVMPFIRIKPKKRFKNAHCEFYKQFSCRKRMLLIQSPCQVVECKVCQSHVRGEV